MNSLSYARLKGFFPGPEFASACCSHCLLLLAAFLVVGLPAALPAQTIGDRMVTWLSSKLNQRIAGGECAHVASEALRVAGAQFSSSDPGNGDYIWSSTLVSRVTSGASGPAYSHPAALIRPGDVLQYHNARFSNGAIALHHTSVVASVNSAGRVTAVFEQNIGKLIQGSTVSQRFVQKRSLNLATLVGGRVSIYRPMARIIQPRRWEFSIVNNAPSAATFTMRLGTWSSSTSLATANSAASYRTQYLTSSSSTAPTLRVGTTTLTIVDGGGYEIIRTASGGLSVRRLAQ